MRQAIALLRSDAAARSASVIFVFLVSWLIGLQAGKGMSLQQWTAATASICGALLVVILVHGPAAVFGPRKKG